MKKNRAARRAAETEGVDHVADHERNQEERATQSEKLLPLVLQSLQVFDRATTLKILGLSDRTFDRIEAAGQAPPKTYLSPNRIGYRAIDLRAWLDARREVAA